MFFVLFALLNGPKLGARFSRLYDLSFRGLSSTFLSFSHFLPFLVFPSVFPEAILARCK